MELITAYLKKDGAGFYQLDGIEWRPFVLKKDHVIPKIYRAISEGEYSDFKKAASSIRDVCQRYHVSRRKIKVVKQNR